jgi:hypothetical protein
VESGLAPGKDIFSGGIHPTEMARSVAVMNNHVQFNLTQGMIQGTAATSTTAATSPFSLTVSSTATPTFTSVTNNTAVIPVPLCWFDSGVPPDYPGRPGRAVGNPPVPVWDDPHQPPVYEIQDGRPITMRLPDGTMIDVRADGSYTIDDSDAKVVYRASRVRDFNGYLNASDKLEDFILYCGEQGVRQDEMLSIPVKHFVAWLVVEAALADGEEPPAALPDLRDFCQPKLLEAAE